MDEERRLVAEDVYRYVEGARQSYSPKISLTLKFKDLDEERRLVAEDVYRYVEGARQSYSPNI